MGAAMAKPCKGRRQLRLEVGFGVGWGGRDAVGRAYERLLPLLTCAAVPWAQGPSRGARHEEQAPDDRVSSGTAGGGDLRSGLVRPAGRASRSEEHTSESSHATSYAASCFNKH